MLPYAVASLFHHVHNAEFLADYPNMPRWLTPTAVYGAWFITTLVGITGWLLLRKDNQSAGLALIALYGAAGLYGLAHYALAPAAAHSLAMNAGIWLEAVSGLLLFSTALYMAKR